MDDTERLDPHDPPAAPSLAAGLLAAVPRGKRRPRFWFRAGLLLFLVVAALELAGWTRIRQLRQQTGAVDEDAARVAEAHDRLAGFAAAAARPPLDAELERLRAHLPPGARLAEAGRDEAGLIAVAIDTNDPDSLRDTLAADPLLRRLGERGQDRRDDGTMRVRLTGTIG